MVAIGVNLILKMKNIQVTYAGKDFRITFIFDNVNRLILDKVSVPVMILNGVKAPLLQDFRFPGDDKKFIKIQ